MDKDDVKRIVYNHLKDDYYIKLRALENDIDFFLMYMERNKKSDFRFDLRISHNGSFKAFNDIWKKYGYHKSEVETAFSEYMLLKFIIEDIYNNAIKYIKKIGIDEVKLVSISADLAKIIKKDKYEALSKIEERKFKMYKSMFLECNNSLYNYQNIVKNIGKEKVKDKTINKELLMKSGIVVLEKYLSNI